MAEVAHTGEDHGDPGLVGGGDHLGVAHRAARLDHRADAGLGRGLELGGVDPSSAEARDVAHEIALHVSFAAPAYLTRDEVPDDVVAREREVLSLYATGMGAKEVGAALFVSENTVNDHLRRIRGVDESGEMRVSTFPTVWGEKAVVRLFAGSAQFQLLGDLGFPEDVLLPLGRLLNETSGAILATGTSQFVFVVRDNRAVRTRIRRHQASTRSTHPREFS